MPFRCLPEAAEKGNYTSYLLIIDGAIPERARKL
jgi:hypothetical protein